MEQIVEKILDAIKNGKDLTYSQDGITITVHRDEKAEFKAFLDQLDDDLFIETCELLDVQKIQECLDSDDIEAVRSAIIKFKSALHEVIENKIEYLKSFL